MYPVKITYKRKYIILHVNRKRNKIYTAINKVYKNLDMIMHLVESHTEFHWMVEMSHHCRRDALSIKVKEG